MPSTSITRLLSVAILTGSISLLAGCATRGNAPARPDLPMAFHFMEPGSTNVVIVPPDCAYGIWTTDNGLLYLQGLTP